MGTSTSYGGSPKWKSVKNAVSRAAGQGPLSSDKASSTVRAFVAAMAKSRTGGFGAHRGAGQGSRGGSGGRRGRTGKSSAGVRGAASAIGQFLRDVQDHGLREALKQVGVSDIDNLSPTDLVLQLAELLGGGDSTIDGADLQNALCELLRSLTEGANTLSDAESLMRDAGAHLEQVIRDLIGNYIFERYNTTFSSTLDQRLAVSQTDVSLDEVRRFIDTEVELRGVSRDLSGVNWRGQEGAAIVDEILQQTIAVFQVNE